MKRIAAIATSVGLAVGALAVGGAAPAAAATITYTVSCTVGNDIDAVTNVVVSPGDTIYVTAGAECDYAWTTDPALFSSRPTNTTSGTPPYTWVVSPDAAPGVYGSSSSPIIYVDNNSRTCSGALDSFCGQWFYLTIMAPGTSKDLTIWQKQIGRASAEASCPDGYTGSWAEWPNGGTGGWVCNKDTYAYYPDVPVQ